MSEIKPVANIKTWQEEAKEWPEHRRGLATNQMIWMQQEIDELRAAYEALKAENTKLEDDLDQYKEYYEEISEHYRALQFIESELRKEIEAQAKRIANLEELLDYYKNMVGA